MKLFVCLLLLIVVSAASAEDWPWAKYGLPARHNRCSIPLKRTDWAESYHTNMLTTEKKPDRQIVFLGDSITMMWRSQSGYEGGTPVWEKYYAPRQACNLGISGDRTEHVLWRITEGGDLDGLNPKVLVLMIGINNRLQDNDKPQWVAAGIKTIVDYIKVKLPTTKLLLLGDFPCWEQPTDPARQWVKEVNALIAPLADHQRVWYLDLGPKFLEPDGTIVKAKLRDMLHLSEIGYGLWAKAMEPYLVDLLDGEGKGEVWGKQP
ncbi:MAG: GDSL-type esterase/lipase family protein [Armatimonadota bacterium]